MKVTSRWPTAPLGDVVEETQYGTSLKANDQGDGVPVLRMGNITYSGAVDLTDLKHVEMPAKDLAQYSVRRGDLLFNRTNSQELVGKMGVWNRDEPFAFAGYLVRLRLKPDRADPAFIAAWFNTTEMKTLLRTRAKPSINMSNINATEVLKFPVVLPPLAEQRRIAEVLDRAEALRAKRRAALAQLDSLTQSLFLDLFGDPGSADKKFPIQKLGEVALKITDGEHQTPKRTTEGIKLLSARNIRDGFIDTEDVDHVGQEEYERIRRRCDPKVGDILISCSGTIGRVAIVKLTEPLSLVRSVALVKPDRGIHEPEFLEHYLRTPAMKARMIRSAHSSSQANLFQGPIRDLDVFVPPITLQREFARRVTAVEALKRAQSASLAELDALFATLQHRAFREQL
jgi:type I restriction enzyme S subunit